MAEQEGKLRNNNNNDDVQSVSSDDDDNNNKNKNGAPNIIDSKTGATMTAAAKKNATLLPMDWTKQGINNNNNNKGDGDDDHHVEIAIRYPTDVTDISKDDDLDIIIIGTAGQKITNIGPDFYKYVNPALETLVLRSHLITKMEGLDNLPSIHLLELYDNQINELNCLQSLSQSLIVLDISFNVIRDMKPVEHCIHLEELYIANNKLKEMTGLKGLSKLRKLDLGANRIRIMDKNELDGLINLEELWLGKNKIEVMNGLDNLNKLRRLDIQSNRLIKIDNIIHTELLEEMYFAHNGITDDGLLLSLNGINIERNYPNLTVLDLSRNQITTTKSFINLLSLEELWISGNQISDFKEIEPLHTLGQTLQTIYLEYNPIQSLDPLYRKKIHEIIPSLQQIDAYMIGGSSNIPTVTIISKKKEEHDPVKQIIHDPTLSETNKAKQLQDLILQKATIETNNINLAAK